MKIIDTEDFNPICPHCEYELETIIRIQDNKGWFQGRLGYCYACPSCRKVIGFADYSSS